MSYLEETNKRQVKNARVATSILKDEVYPSINAAYQAVRQVLLEYGDVTSIRDVNRLNAAINKVINDNLTDGFATASASMATLATSDAVFTAGLLSSAAGVALKAPTETQADKFIRQSIMSLSSGNKKQSAIWSDFVKGYEGTMANRYNSIVTAAYNDSLTTGKMQTVGQLTKQFRDLNNNLQRHEAETLIRTASQHYTSRANQLMADSNSDIIDREVPVITFDSRTSDTCISINARYSKGWPQGKSPIGYPPYHFNAVVGGEIVKTSSGNKKIEDVAVGDLVVTHKGRLRPVTAVMRKPCDTGVAREITFESGLTITVTDEHPLLIDGLGWIRADEVKVGHNLFKNVKKISKLLSWSSVAKRNPNDYPSIFDGDEVFTEVWVLPGVMSSSVDLDTNPMGFDSKIHNSVIGNELMGKFISAIGLSAIINKCKLAFDGVDSMSTSLSDHKRSVSSVTMKRVGFFHSFGVHFSKFMSFFSHPISPVKLAFVFCASRYSYFMGFFFTHGLNSVNPTPATHSSISETELSLNPSKSFFKGMVVKLEEFSKVFFVNKFNHWDSQVVKSISIVEHKGMVYNLEIKDDHTYLINGIVTHNCRTVIGYLLFGQKEFEGTKASKGAEGGKQISASTPFAKFLRDQPKSFVYETLGKARGQLFLDGKLPLANLTDKYLSPLRLDQLDID